MIIIDYIAKAIGAFTILVVAWLLFVSMYPAYDTRRFRVTIDVQTPEGIKTDTSTIE